MNWKDRKVGTRDDKHRRFLGWKIVVWRGGDRLELAIVNGDRADFCDRSFPMGRQNAEWAIAHVEPAYRGREGEFRWIPVWAPESKNHRARRKACELLLTAMRLYPNYRVDSRGPRGVLWDAIKLLSPEIFKVLDEDDWDGAYKRFVQERE